MQKARPVFLTVVYVMALVASIGAIAWAEDDGSVGYVVSYGQWFRVGVVLLFGWLAVGSAARATFAITVDRTPEMAGSLRVIVRVAGYGILVALLVSSVTESAAAALTLGSFAGLVAGYASSAVMGNTLAGLLLSLTRPVNVGDAVTISGHSGVVHAITIMHVVLDTTDSQILIPSAQVVGAVLTKRTIDNDEE